MFWSRTPRQLALLLDRDKERRRAADRRAGEVAVMVYNTRRDMKKDPKGKTWLDVFPEHREPDPAQTEEAMLATMLLWAKVSAPRKMDGT